MRLQPSPRKAWKEPVNCGKIGLNPSSIFKKTGGERGIRTPDRLLTCSRFPGVCFKPLSHLSAHIRQLDHLFAVEIRRFNRRFGPYIVASSAANSARPDSTI